MLTLKKYYRFKINKLKQIIQLRDVAIMYSPNMVTTGFLEALQKRDQILLDGSIKKFTFMNYKRVDGLTHTDIEQARSHLISEYIPVNRAKNALCLFHNDKVASMHIYDGNRYHCFSCSASGTSIDIVMQLYSLKFADAVSRMLGR
jgi:hypothetical protein